MASQSCRSTFAGLTAAVAIVLPIGFAPHVHAQFNFDELSVSVSPPAPTSEQTFDLRAFKWFGDPGQQRIEQSISIEGDRIHVYVLMEDLHCCYAFPQVVWADGAFFDDIGPLDAGTYHVDAEMWMRDRRMFGGTTEPVLLSTGSLTFDVVGVQNQQIIDGDYNADGVVNAADYTVWRDTVGSTEDLAADGDGSGAVDDHDFDMWRSHYGEAGSAASLSGLSSVPEPTSFAIATALTVIAAGLRRSICITTSR